MTPRTAALALALTSGLLAGAALLGDAWADPGAVLGNKKINSDTLAAFGAPLNDGDEFADALANLGDLDGPGPSVLAVAVGVIGDDDGGAHRGAVDILFLNDAGHVISCQKISLLSGGFTGTLDSGDEFGGALAWLGDLDGAGPSVGALAVGVGFDDDGGTDQGAVYILFLNANGTVLSHQKISETVGGFAGTLDALDEFGVSLSGLGDLDGPGPSVAALAVGSVGDDDGGDGRGAAYILFLNPDGTVLSHQKISSTQGNFTAPLGTNDDLGEDVCYLGDLDGAGPSVATLAVSAVSDDDGGSDRGCVYIMFLNANGTVLSHQTLSDTQGNFGGPLADGDNWGTAIAPLGDLDGPGPAAITIAVSAGSDDGIGVDRGALYLLFLDATGACLSYLEYSTTAGSIGWMMDEMDEFGSALAPLGDLNGAGVGEQFLACGVSYDDDGGINRGAFFTLTLEGAAVAGVDDLPAATGGFRQVRPNPFSRSAAVSFRLEQAGLVRVDVCDAGGRRVRTLVHERIGAGDHRAAWDGRDDAGRPQPPGAYYLTMSVDGRTRTAAVKTILIR